MKFPTAELGEVATLNPRRQATLSTAEMVSFVSMAGLSAEEGSVTDEQTRTYGQVAKGYTPFSNGDVLVAKITPCFENNKIGQAKLSRPLGFGSTEFHVIRARPGLTDARYLMHYLRQDHVREEGQRKMTGSAGQRRVPLHFLANLAIPVPPLAQQRRIAAILDQADALRAKRRKVVAQLEALGSGLFRDIFGDTITNPHGWGDRLVLGDIASVSSGITKGRKLPGKTTRTVPYLAVSNVQDQSLNLAMVKTIDATEDEIERYRLKPNDIVVTEGGDPDKLGRGVMWNGEIKECIHQNHIFRIRVTAENVDPTFLLWLIGSTRGKEYFLRAAKQTTGIASINMSQLRAFRLLVPPLALQHRFKSALVKLQSLRSLADRSMEATNALFTSLQHRAFRGEL